MRGRFFPPAIFFFDDVLCGESLRFFTSYYFSHFPIFLFFLSLVSIPGPACLHFALVAFTHSARLLLFVCVCVCAQHT